MLFCIECGCCSGELGKGWVAFRCDDPDPDEPNDGEAMLAVYCPPCATREFGYRPDVGATYVCSWESVPGATWPEHDLDTFARLLEPPTHEPATTGVRREPARAFGVTMVRPGVMPSFEVGVYEYYGRGLPLVGETIVIRRTQGPEAGEVKQGYVTRLNPESDTPIAVTEVARDAARLGGAG